MAPYIDVSPQKSSQHSSQRSDPPPANVIPIDKRAGDLAIRIRQANGRLKAGNMGMRIEIRRNKFYLRGILPANPAKSHPPKQQVRSTQILANIANLPVEEQLAKWVTV